MSPRSQWLEGRIRHRRHSPVQHAFQYSTGLLAVDLDEWHELDRFSPWLSTRFFNWIWLRRADYFQPDREDMEQAVRDYVWDRTGWRPDGSIQLITQPRYLGFCFNPVSFYFCYEANAVPGSGDVPRVILAQITNTPWLERHTYCLEGGALTEGQEGWRTRRFRFAKAFHVSPFNPMDQDYDWLFSFRPGEYRIHMNVARRGARIFDATLMVQSVPLARKTLHRALVRFPLQSFSVVGGIYWNALRLKLKGAVFHSHPDKQGDAGSPPGQSARRENNGD